MDKLLETKKREIIKYITNSNNEISINSIYDIVHEEDVKYNSFDFEKEWANGYTAEESKQRVKDRIASWWGK